MTHSAIAKGNRNGLPRWGVKLTYRLAQTTKKAGTYDLTLKVKPDGSRLIKIGGKWEKL